MSDLTGKHVVAAVAVAMPQGFLKNSARTSGVETGAVPAWIREYEATIDPTLRDLEINKRMNGVLLGVSADELFVAARSFTGKPKELLRQEPLAGCRIGWLDHEERRVHTRLFHVEFPDKKWMFGSDGWSKRTDEDAITLVQTAGAAAHALTELAAFRDATQ